MPVARAQKPDRADTSFGPFRFVEAVPWLMVALAFRIAGMNETPWWPLALAGESIAVLLAFIAIARRVFEMFGHPARFHDRTFGQQLRLSLRLFGAIVLVMVAATALMAVFGHAPMASYCLLGVDGMAFSGPTVFGRIWGAVVAALVLLLMLGVNSDSGKINIGATLRGAIDHGARFGAAVVIVIVFYMALGLLQGAVRNNVWGFWPITVSSPNTRNLIYFVLTLGFAALRLWVALLVLASGLKTFRRPRVKSR
jgi:hypothetical protein